MNAGKSLEILRVVHNYEERGQKVILFTTSLDNRFGVGKVTSRVGLSKAARIIDDNVFEVVKEEMPECVICDEVHFYSVSIIDELARVVDELNIPVLTYGLRGDFQQTLFSGSERLLAIADKIEEIKTMCWYSDDKALFNLRLHNGKPVFEGEQIQIGGNESYYPVCRKCYMKFKREISK
jgi:thymidine kinase